MAAGYHAAALRADLAKTRSAFLSHFDRLIEQQEQLGKAVNEQAYELGSWKSSSLEMQAHYTDRRPREPRSDNFVAIIINANLFTFDVRLVQKGHDGGVEAAAQLHHSVLDFLPTKDSDKVLLSLYVHQSKWSSMYSSRHIASPNVCFQFLNGFKQAYPLWNVLDAVDEADVAVKAASLFYLYTDVTACKAIFCGGFDQAVNYMAASADSFKFVILDNGEPSCSGNDRVAKLPIEGVFGTLADPPLPDSAPSPTSSDASKRQALPRTQTAPFSSVAGRSYSSTVATQSGDPMPNKRTASKVQTPRRSPSSGSLASSDAPRKTFYRNGDTDKTVDPTKPLYKNSPAPCNRFYLTEAGCNANSGCPFSHEYKMTQHQLETLAQDAKKSPCSYLNSGRRCPLGPDVCHMGHYCPDYHTGCKYGDKCKFNLPGMHPPAKKGGLGAFPPASDSD